VKHLARKGKKPDKMIALTAKAKVAGCSMKGLALERKD
jgi:hypothetical protein